jgi:hypothetical protein
MPFEHRRAPEVSPRIAAPREDRGTPAAQPPGMKKTKKQAGLVLGVIVAMIPVGWAKAADAPPPGEPARFPASAVQSSPPLPEAWVPYADSYLDYPGQAFYEAVGRHDLALAYDRRSTGKNVLRAVGAAAAVGGGLWMLGRAFMNRLEDPDYCVTACNPGNETSDSYLGPGLTMLAGAGLYMASSAISVDPVDFQGRRGLAHAAFRRRYPELLTSMNVGVVPAERGGGNVVLSGRF